MSNRLIATISQMDKPLIAKKFEMDNPLIAKKFEMDNPPAEIFFKKAQHAIKKFFQSPRFHQKVCIPSFPIKMFRSPPPGGFFVLFSVQCACFSFMYWVKYFM